MKLLREYIRESINKFPNKTEYNVFGKSFSCSKNLYFSNNSFIAIDNENFDVKTFMCNDDDPEMRNYGIRSIDSKTFNQLFSNKIQKIFPGTTIIMMTPARWGNTLRHYFHFCEHLIGLWATYKELGKSTIENILLLGDGIEPGNDWKGQNEINLHLIKAIFPDANIISPDKFLNSDTLFQFNDVISSDLGITLVLPKCSDDNKLLGESKPFIKQKHIIEMAQLVHDYMGTKHKPRENSMITYIHRNAPRRLATNVENNLIKKISELKNYDFQKIDFSNKTFKEQLEIIGNTDILLGVHGNGFTHSLFLPGNATVLEIFPKSSHHLDYKYLCDLRGIKHYAIDSQKGPYTSKQSYSLKHAGHGDITNTEIKQLCINDIIKLIKKHK